MSVSCQLPRSSGCQVARPLGVLTAPAWHLVTACWHLWQLTSGPLARWVPVARLPAAVHTHPPSPLGFKAAPWDCWLLAIDTSTTPPPACPTDH